MKCITLEYPDGSVAIRGGLGPNMLARFKGDREAALQYILKQLVPQQNPGATARVENVTFPDDRDFRDAWVRRNGTIETDMPKARAIHRDRMREARAPELAKLDVDYQRADERGDKIEKQRIAAKKQALRDVTDDPAIEAAETPGQLRAVWPKALPRGSPP